MVRITNLSLTAPFLEALSLVLCHCSSFGRALARLQNCSRARPMAKHLLSHWLQGRGWRWGEPSGRAARWGGPGWWGEPSGRAAGWGGAARPEGSPHPCTPLARHWLCHWQSAHAPGSTPLAKQLLSQCLVRSSFAGAPVRAPSESNCFAQGLAFPKTLPVTGKGRERFVRITFLSQAFG